MTDKELLELSAKAAGIKINSWYGSEQEWYWAIHTPRQTDDIGWNPLTEDGDALRLAVKLEMEIYVDLCKCHIRVRYFDKYIYEDFSKDGGVTVDDPYAATRRAITRAAAEIGRSME